MLKNHCERCHSERSEESRSGRERLTGSLLERKSLLPLLQGQQREGHEAIYWEHDGNSAVRQGKWKLVSCYPEYWEPHEMEADRTEQHNLADAYPGRVREMAGLLDVWAKRVGVKPWPLPGMKPETGGYSAPDYLKR
jgi:arylsulfatase